MLDLPYLTAFHRRFGGSGLHSAVIANEQGRLTYDDIVSFTMPPPYEGEVSLRPATNDLFTFDEVFLSQVYGELKSCRPDVRTVIDLGANLGFASLYFLHHYTGCRVFAVEPDHMNYLLLRKNLAAFTATGRVITLQAAFWKEDGQVVFEPAPLAHEVNKGSVRSLNQNERPRSHAIVQALSMRSIVARSGFEVVDLLKVDIEGGEQHLFSGDSNWLSETRCIAIEFHGSSRRLSRFDAIVAEHGFVVVEPNPHTVIATR